MISYQFYREFITSFHPNYNGDFLKPISWCSEPKDNNDGFIEFINRAHRNYIQVVFFAKYDFNNKNIIIRCEYNYFLHYLEKSETTIIFNGYKDNTYNYMNIHGEMINHLADEEIVTFIKLFDQFFLEQTNIPLLKEEYDLYMKHLKYHPELISIINSESYNILTEFNYNHHEYCIILRFYFYNKQNKMKDSIEYYIFKNRIVGDDFNDLDSNLNYEMTKRLDDINIDFITFSQFRLK